VKALSRLLILLSLISLNCASQSKPSDIAARIERQIRATYKLPPEAPVVIGPLSPSSDWPGYQAFTVTVYLPPQISSARQSGSQFIFSWQAPAGQMYQVEYKNDLSAAPWTPVGNPMTGSGAPLSFTNGISASVQRFFRLRILP
jgi:hypothetical protein